MFQDSGSEVFALACLVETGQIPSQQVNASTTEQQGGSREVRSCYNAKNHLPALGQVLVRMHFGVLVTASFSFLLKSLQ